MLTAGQTLCQCHLLLITARSSRLVLVSGRSCWECLGCSSCHLLRCLVGVLRFLFHRRWFIVYCLFGVLRCFQHCTGHITTGSWKGRGNQYIQFARVLYCKLPTNGKQLPAFPLTAMTGIEPRPQRWEARVLRLCHRGPS